MDEPAIRVCELTRNFGPKWALFGVSFAVEPGRIVALMGPNGAGKTTLLKILGGVLTPTEGEAKVLGAPASQPPPENAWRVLSLIEGHEPPPWATPERMGVLAAEAVPSFDQRAYAERLREGGITPATRYGDLSKGQKRWALAVLCLSSGADVLLLDEPADGLDPLARRAIYDALRDYANDRGATILIATHAIHDIERIADDAAFLMAGRLVLFSSVEDLRESVREVEYAAEGGEPPWPDSVEVLAQKDVGKRIQAWVRGTGATDWRELESIGEVRPVGLEDLYLALASCTETDSVEPLEAANHG